MTEFTGRDFRGDRRLVRDGRDGDHDRRRAARLRDDGERVLERLARSAARARVRDQPSEGCEQIERNGCFAVNILHAEQEPLSRYFASRDRPRGRDAFLRSPTASPPPAHRSSTGWRHTSTAACTPRTPAGDHEIFIGEVLELGVGEDTTPLLFHGGRLPPDRRSVTLLRGPTSCGGATSRG